MIITPLGHTEFLVDITNDNGENVRILVDSWLSDYAVGDIMERSVKVRIDREKLNTLDAIYISHSHTDHFDPYTLVEIYGQGSFGKELAHSDGGFSEIENPPPFGHPLSKGGSPRPLLLLPFTLGYLVPLIQEYLGDIPLEILYPGKSYILNGIEVTGYMFAQSQITNEDDVMMIAIDNNRELIFAEIDTLPEDDNEDVQNQLYKILTNKDYETVCYLASRNELEGQLPLLDTPVKKRKSWRAEYIAGRKDAMYAAYQKYEYEDFAGFENIYAIPNLVRGFIGQGISYPESLSTDYSRLQIFPLDEIASMESDIARECGYQFPQRAILPGRQYRAEFGTLEPGRKECQIGELIMNNEKGKIDTEDQRIYASGPLFPRTLESSDIQKEKERIRDILNNRFLAYWSASPVAPLRDALLKNNGIYRIAFRMTNDEGGIIFEYSTARTGFIEVPYILDMYIDEQYWLLDVVDFLDGGQELYSNFWHKLNSKRIYRLWTCLGANFCNNDLVINKYRFHFELIRQGLTVRDFAEGILKNITKS